MGKVRRKKFYKKPFFEEISRAKKMPPLFLSQNKYLSIIKYFPALFLKIVDKFDRQGGKSRIFDNARKI